MNYLLVTISVACLISNSKENKVIPDKLVTTLKDTAMDIIKLILRSINK